MNDNTSPSALFYNFIDFMSFGSFFHFWKQRFIPSEFGNEVGRVDSAPPPFQRLCDTKKKIRRAIEDAGIPYSFISANSFMAYFVDVLLQHRQKPQPGELAIYGDGITKGMATQHSFNNK